VAALVRYAREWLPGVDPTRRTATTCLYTTTPDRDFLIDRVGPLTVLGGFSGHGFKHAPAIGELATGLVLDNGPTDTVLPRPAVHRPVAASTGQCPAIPDRDRSYRFGRYGLGVWPGRANSQTCSDERAGSFLD
jgi:FAD dependent oxidoreductase